MLKGPRKRRSKLHALKARPMTHQEVRANGRYNHVLDGSYDRITCLSCCYLFTLDHLLPDLK